MGLRETPDADPGALPAQVIDRGIPAAGLLTQVMHVDHYRCTDRKPTSGAPAWSFPARHAWVACGVRLQPPVDALKEAILAHRVLHADETPVVMLKPGTGKTHRAYLWAYTPVAFDLSPYERSTFGVTSPRANLHTAPSVSGLCLESTKLMTSDNVRRKCRLRCLAEIRAEDNGFATRRIALEDGVSERMTSFGLLAKCAVVRAPAAATKVFDRQVLFPHPFGARPTKSIAKNRTGSSVGTTPRSPLRAEKPRLRSLGRSKTQCARVQSTTAPCNGATSCQSATGRFPIAEMRRCRRSSTA